MDQQDRRPIGYWLKHPDRLIEDTRSDARVGRSFRDGTGKCSIPSKRLAQRLRALPPLYGHLWGTTRRSRMQLSMTLRNGAGFDASTTEIWSSRLRGKPLMRPC